MVGIRSFPFGIVYFQVGLLLVSRECTPLEVYRLLHPKISQNGKGDTFNDSSFQVPSRFVFRPCSSYMAPFSQGELAGSFPGPVPPRGPECSFLNERLACGEGEDFWIPVSSAWIFCWGKILGIWWFRDKGQVELLKYL